MLVTIKRLINTDNVVLEQQIDKGFNPPVDLICEYNHAIINIRVHICDIADYKVGIQFEGWLTNSYTIGNRTYQRETNIKGFYDYVNKSGQLEI